ncbi:MAG: tetratricopeptide repeat protein [Phycisphaerales bacterium]|jgi:tetratricopeptide (TPR) repeat protein
MKKYKKAGQRRKKHKKTGQRKTRTSGQSQPSFSSTRRKAVRVLVVLVIVCAATAGVVSVRFLLHTDDELKETKRPPNHTDHQVVLPVIEPPRTEQELVVLKEEELRLADELLEDFPGRDDPLVVMGNVWYRHGNAVEALKFWKEALKINPKRPDVYKCMGWLSIKKGEFGEAITHYRKALDMQPQLSDVHSNIAHALMMLGRHDEAIEEIEKEIQISPNSSFAYFLLGQVYLQQKQLEKAQQNYEVAVKINPEYTNAYYGLGTVCSKLGNSDGAKAHLEKFRKLKAEERKGLKGRKIQYDDFTETQKGAAITYVDVGRMYRDHGKLHKAEELLKKAAGLDPENVVCFLELASLYQANGQLSKALQMHKKIREIQPESPICHFMIGVLSARLKQFDDAEEAFRKVITLAPQKSDAYRELARLYLRTEERLPQARQLAEKAVALEAVAANYFALSMACYRNGDTANAFSAVKRAVELEPGNQQYLRLYKIIQQRN